MWHFGVAFNYGGQEVCCEGLACQLAPNLQLCRNTMRKSITHTGPGQSKFCGALERTSSNSFWLSSRRDRYVEVHKWAGFTTTGQWMLTVDLVEFNIFLALMIRRSKKSKARLHFCLLIEKNNTIKNKIQTVLKAQPDIKLNTNIQPGLIFFVYHCLSFPHEHENKNSHLNTFLRIKDS